MYQARRTRLIQERTEIHRSLVQSYTVVDSRNHEDLIPLSCLKTNPENSTLTALQDYIQAKANS